jgi:hypothetical protein
VENKEECSIPTAVDAEEKALFQVVPAAVEVEDWVEHSIAYAAAVAEQAHAN